MIIRAFEPAIRRKAKDADQPPPSSAEESERDILLTQIGIIERQIAATISDIRDLTADFAERCCQ